jgi:tripeptide aminopeptidase
MKKPILDPVALVEHLLAIPGKSGEESAAADFIIAQMRAAGVPASAIASDAAHERSPFGGQRGNLIVTLPASQGRAREPRRLLMAHIDTVPICIGCKPVTKQRVIRSADSATGLGGDDRAGAAAILAALMTIVHHKLPHPPLTFLWCVQEEVGLMGARYVDQGKLGNPAMGFNFDGGKPSELTIGATGAYRMAIHVTGVPAHAGVHPERGVSAITLAALAIARLEREGWLGLVKKPFVRGSSNVGVIQGGQATNVVTESVFLRAECRAHDQGLRKRILNAYIRSFEQACEHRHASTGAGGSVKFDISEDYESFKLPRHSPVVRAGIKAAKAQRLRPTLRVSNGGLDANWMNAHGIPTVTFGVGQHEIHTTNEYLDLKEFKKGCGIALHVATS